MSSSPQQSDLPPIALMWENFGPTHHDRTRALSQAGFSVGAIELHATSSAYRWERDEGGRYTVLTLADSADRMTGPMLFWRLLRATLRTRARHVFFCQYQHLPVVAAAAMLRLLGRRVYTMVDSKFDDYPRHIWREIGKSLYMLPYCGAIAGSRRTREYLSFLGIPRDAIELGYDMIDTARLRAAADVSASDQPFAMRPFLVVARLVPKKNIPFILEAFAQYRRRFSDGRELHVIGYGPLERALIAEAERLGIGDSVRFLGFRPSHDVAQAMAASLALILASTEEQFGLVINEALSVGLPVIVSNNAGAVDLLVENLGNGIVIDPHQTETLVLAMAHVAGDEARWRAMQARARETSVRADTAEFRDAVLRLVLPAGASVAAGDIAPVSRTATVG